MSKRETFISFPPYKDKGVAGILLIWQMLENGEATNFVAIYDDGRFNFQSEGDKTDLLSTETYPEKFEQLSKILTAYE
ncbi:MAG: hypothetical protein ABS942_04330 [Solibacillus sp.]